MGFHCCRTYRTATAASSISRISMPTQTAPICRRACVRQSATGRSSSRPPEMQHRLAVPNPGCRSAGISPCSRTHGRTVRSTRAGPRPPCNGWSRKACGSRSRGSSSNPISQPGWAYRRMSSAFRDAVQPGTTITSTFRSGDSSTRLKIELSLSHRYIANQPRLPEPRRHQKPQRTISCRRDLLQGLGVPRFEIVKLKARGLDLGAALVEHTRHMFAMPDRSGASREHAVERRRLSALRSREVGVARRHREAVQLADGWGGDDLDRQIKIGREPCHDFELLEILLAEYRNIGKALDQKLAHRDRDTREELRAERVLEPDLGRSFRNDPGGEAGPV